MMIQNNVYNRLRNQIIDGSLVLGQKINELQLSKELGVPRYRISKELKVLSAQSLVEYKKNIGYSVVNLSAKDAYEIFYLRGMLEIKALELCKGVLDDYTVIQLETIANQMYTERKNRLKVIDLDDKFHEEIVKSGNMKRLVDLWKSLSPLNAAMFLKVDETFEIGDEDLKHEIFGPDYVRRPNANIHGELLDVLRRNDFVASRKALEEHYFRIGEFIYRQSLL